MSIGRHATLIAVCLLAACGSGGDANVATISQAEAEAVRDECVAEGLRALQQLADRIAPLARARSAEDLEATAAELGCLYQASEQGYAIYCPALGATLWLSFEFEGIPVDDPARAERTTLRFDEGALVGEMRLHFDPERGAVLDGELHRTSSLGCVVVLEFSEVSGLEAYGTPGGSLGLYFTEGSVEVDVHDAANELLAQGTAALTGRAAFLALNFDGLALLGELALD